MTSAADQPLASIFMFVRNGGKSLRRAVDSVFAQTYPNIEFVVQDAVSTDGTLDLLRSYGDRIKIVSEPELGPKRRPVAGDESMHRRVRRILPG